MIDIVHFTISKYGLIVESTICIVDKRKNQVIVGSTIRVKCFIFLRILVYRKIKKTSTSYCILVEVL